MNTAIQKAELIQWINSLDNVEILKEVEAIKAKATFDFEKEWARSISGDELRKKSKEFIKSLPWEK